MWAGFREKEYPVRVGRPIKALPQPLCDYCGVHAALVKYAEAAYPYREDHGALWVCTTCEAWIGIHSRSTRNVPLGRFADGALRDAKSRLHDTLEPLIAGKVRRDRVNRLRPARKPSDGSPANLASSRCQDRSITFHSNSASRQSGMSKHSSRIAAPHRLVIGLKRSLTVADILIAKITREP
jgi:hypothetical protein